MAHYGPFMPANSEAVNTIVEMGFTEQQATDALAKYNNVLETAIENLLMNPSQEADPELNMVMVESMNPVNNDADADLDQAIAASLQDISGQDTPLFQPNNPDLTNREDGIPVGLKNVGNTCYFNSLIQTYLMIPKLVIEVMKFVPHESHFQDNEEDPKKKMNLFIVNELQRLFAYMMRSNRKYIDPSRFLNTLVDDFGSRIMIGEQRDVGEFAVNLVNRIEEGLNLSEPFKEQEEEKQPEDSMSQPQTDARYSQRVSKEDQKITFMFFGQQIEILSYNQSTGQRVETKQEVSFHQIIVDLDEQELVFAWDQRSHCTLPYKTPEGNETQANLETWVQTPPVILSFQVNRVEYDKETSMGRKIHKPFHFQRDIYIDRFLMSNRNVVLPLRQQEEKLKARAKVLQEAIASFENYKETGKSLVFHIEQTMHMLQSQQGARPTPLPENLLKLESDSQETLGNAIQILLQYKQTIEEQISQLYSQLSAVRQEMTNIFAIPELQRHCYSLHSILVHDGHAEGGHYYAYILNHIDGKWRKYSDILITEVDEEEVFRNSIGGQRWTSAYYLIYTDLVKIGQENLYNEFRMYAESMMNIEQDIMDFMPQQLQQEIYEDNKRLVEQQNNSEVDKAYQQIFDLYALRNEQRWNF